MRKFREEKEISIIRKNKCQVPNPVIAFNEIDFPKQLQGKFSE